MPTTNILDVAKRAGVSKPTVSRVINNYPFIKEETRQKVLKVIEELNIKKEDFFKTTELLSTESTCELKYCFLNLFGLKISANRFLRFRFNKNGLFSRLPLKTIIIGTFPTSKNIDFNFTKTCNLYSDYPKEDRISPACLRQIIMNNKKNIN